MRYRKTLHALAALALVAAGVQPAAAQIGIKNPFGGGKKGEVYGLDVTETPAIVFVVDFSLPVEQLQPEAPSLGDQVGEQVKEEAAQAAQRKLVEKGGEVGMMAAGPAGMLVRGALAKRRDKIGQARSHVASGIEGLDDDQSFSVVYFEGAPTLWRDQLVAANKDARKEAVKLVKDVQGGGKSLEQMMMAMAGATTEMQRAMATGEGAGVDLGQALEMALSLEPEMVVLVTGGALHAAGTEPATYGEVPAGALPDAGPTAGAAAADSTAETPDAGPAQPLPDAGAAGTVSDAVSPDRILARVAALNPERKVVIHTALVGEKGENAFLRALAEQNGGTYLTAD